MLRTLLPVNWGVRPLMNQLVRSLLGPFASAAAGAILGIFVAIFVFGVRDKNFLNGFALLGAILGVAPDVLRVMAGVVRACHQLQGGGSKQIEASPTVVTSPLQTQQESEHDARRKLLAAEHEARRPICSHCGKKTEPVFRYRKIDGGPDMRYRNNPVLCNKCFQPYAGVRPWNLPNGGPEL